MDTNRSKNPIEPVPVVLVYTLAIVTQIILYFNISASAVTIALLAISLLLTFMITYAAIVNHEFIDRDR